MTDYLREAIKTKLRKADRDERQDVTLGFWDFHREPDAWVGTFTRVGRPPMRITNEELQTS